MKPGTIGAGADLIRNVNTTLARKSSNEVKVESRNASSSLFQAIASGLAVGSGLRRGVQRPNPVAAAGRDNSAGLDVVYARCKVASNLSTCYGMANLCTQHYAQHHHGNQLDNHRACHYDYDINISWGNESLFDFSST